MKKSALQIADAVRAKPEEPSALRRAAPWLTAAGTGALGYGLLRRRSFAPIGTQLRSLQEAAKNKPFSIATSGGTPWAQKIRSMIMGAPVHTTGEKVKGTVLHHTPNPKGGGDININAGNITDALQDKAVFDRVMREGVGAGPGMASSLPNTMRLDEALKRVGGDPKRLKEIYPDFMLKARSESMGRGIFKSLDDPGVNEAIQNPSQFIFQEKMPIKNEFRVHTIDNEPFTATHRFMPNKTLRGLWNRVAGGGGGAFVPLVGKRRRALHDFIRQSTAHLKPADGKSLSDVGESMHVAWDVAELPDGTFKLIEANPVPGTMMNPGIAQKLQKQITGRWSRPVAALGGTALAGTSGVAANKILGGPSNNVAETSPMKKTADQISWSVLLKVAAGAEGNPEIWRKMVDRIAKSKGIPKPTDAQFQEMFPKDFATSGKTLEDAIQGSAWFKQGTSSGMGAQGSNWNRGSSGGAWGPGADDAVAATEAARQRELMALSLVSGMHNVMGLGAAGSGIGTAATGIHSTTQAKTPEERAAVLGLSGGLAGYSGGSAFDNFRKAKLYKDLQNAMSNPTGPNYSQRVTDISNKIMRKPKAFSPQRIGGLAGVGLGLGGAALWNYLARDKPMSKAAAITPEEIATGLSGRAARPEITLAEIMELRNKLRQEEYAKRRGTPIKWGIGGGLLGAAIGALSSRKKGLGKLPRTLIEAGLGAGLGGFLGETSRSLDSDAMLDRGNILGRIARTGNLKLVADSENAKDYAPFAIGSQPGAKPLTEEETHALRNQVLKQRSLGGAVRGAPFAALSGILGAAAKAPPGAIAESMAFPLLTGTYLGANRAVDQSNTLVDLHNRGYGDLARIIQKDW